MKYMAQSADSKRAVAGVFVDVRRQTVDLYGLFKAGLVTPEQLGLVELRVYPAAFAVDPNVMPSITYVYEGAEVAFSYDQRCGLTRFRISGGDWRYALFVEAEGPVRWQNASPGGSSRPATLKMAVARRKTALFRRASQERIRKMRKPLKPNVIAIRVKAKRRVIRRDIIAIGTFIKWCGSYQLPPEMAKLYYGLLDEQIKMCRKKCR